MKNVYLIYGNNYELIKREIDNISNGAADIVKYDLSMDDVSLAIDDASVVSLFGDKKVVIAENSLFLTTAETDVDHNLKYLEAFLLNDEHENIIIFTCLYDKLDERKKIVKLLKEKSNVIHKEEIDEKNLPNFVVEEFKKDGYEIDYKTANYFVNYVGSNVDIIISEINKMITYKDDDKTISINDVDLVSSKAFKDNIFDFINAIQKKNHKVMFDCYNDLKRVGEEPIKIISMLGKQLFFVYQVKLLSKKHHQDEITKILNVHPYRVKLALESDFLEYELTDLIKKLHNIDYEIKTGKKDRYEAFEDFLLKI